MKKRLPVLVCGLLLSASLNAGELKVTAEHQSAVSLTIYNAGRALVRDRRDIRAADATRRIAFMDVAEKIMPQTVSIDGIEVLEQNYDYDLLSPQALIDKNIGNRVRIARRSKHSGETLEWSGGRILSNNGGLVLQMDDGSLETLANQDFYHLVFDEIPDNLRTTPTLSLLLAEPLSGDRGIDITYLSEGLGWRSDYILQLDDRSGHARLDSWITLDNNSGIDYRDAQLQLLAGEVNMQRPEQRLMLERAMAMQARVQSDVREQALHGYHLYTVPFKTTLRNRQSKQIKLFARDQVKVEKSLLDRAHIDLHDNQPQKSSPLMKLLIANSKPALGIPLPQGTVRVYANDDSGNRQFLGEDGIGHTAVNDEVRIELGRSFDVSVERRSTRVIQRSQKQQLVSREIRVNNGSDKPQRLQLSEIMPTHQWSIRSASQQHEQSGPTEARFDLQLAPMKELTLSYEVMLTFP